MWRSIVFLALVGCCCQAFPGFGQPVLYEQSNRTGTGQGEGTMDTDRAILVSVLLGIVLSCCTITFVWAMYAEGARDRAWRARLVSYVPVAGDPPIQPVFADPDEETATTAPSAASALAV